MTTQFEFLRYLRHDLIHLYDSNNLLSSPLVALLGISAQSDPSTALHNILTKAIESLKPSDEYTHSHAWEVYEALFYRYVEQLSPQEVADQLAISPRHLRRKQREALTILADSLWKQYRLGTIAERDERSADFFDLSQARGNTMDKELAWLKDTSHVSSVNLYEILPVIQRLTGKLALKNSVRLNLSIPEVLPSLLIHPAALRQILLSLLSAAIPRVQGGEISILVKQPSRDVQIHILCNKSPMGLKGLLNGEIGQSPGCI